MSANKANEGRNARVAREIAAQLADAWPWGHSHKEHSPKAVSLIQPIIDREYPEPAAVEAGDYTSPTSEHHLSHEAYVSLLRRADEYDGDDWEKAHKFERHAINATLDLRNAYAVLKTTERATEPKRHGGAYCRHCGDYCAPLKPRRLR